MSDTARRIRTWERLVQRYQQQIAHKREVAARHSPGTPYHTRAMREISGYQQKITVLQQKIKAGGN